MDDTYDNILNKLSIRYNKPKEVIKSIVESQFGFTRETIKEIDLDTIQEIKDLEDSKTTFNFMGFGKLYINMKKLKAIRKNINK
jgi:hypothetical protein